MVRAAPSGATAAATQITADTPFGPDDDKFHRSPDDNPYWAETTWWSFNIPERKIGGWLHGQFNTNRGTVTWRVYVWDPSGAEQSDLRYFRMATDIPVTDPAPDLRDITIPGGGFSVKMIRPLRDYEIEFEDSADAAGWAPLNHGWLLQDGRFELLDKSASRMKNYRDPLTGWSSHMQVDLVDVRGRTLGAEGIAASHICERGGGSTALMRWDLGSEIGWGEDQDIWHPKHFARMRDALQAVR